jgi:hypothetical protein
MGQTVEQVEGISTHSNKGTPLSWCAKFGLDLKVRQLLGHHISSDLNSTLTYSRDAQAHPLREYDRVLGHIRTGWFNPDTTRSGFLRSSKRLKTAVASEPRQLAQLAQVEEAALPPVLEDGYAPWTGSADEASPSEPDSCMSQDSSSCSGSDVDDLAHRLLAKVRSTVSSLPEGCTSFECIRSGLMHVRLKDSDNRVACMKIITRSFAQRAQVGVRPKCIPCFAKIERLSASA